MATNALSKIRAEAKRIMKKSPNKKYQTALKEAGRAYRGGKISGTKKKRSPTKRVSSGRKISGSVSSTIGATQGAYKKALTEKLGWLMATQATAKTKREKKALAPQIADYKKKLRALN